MTKKISIITDKNDKIININNGEKTGKKFTIVDKEELEEAFEEIELDDDERLIRYYDGEKFYHEIEKVENEKYEI